MAMICYAIFCSHYNIQYIMKNITFLLFGLPVFGWPFVKQFAVCFGTVLSVCPVLSVLSVTLVYRIVAKQLDGSR